MIFYAQIVVALHYETIDTTQITLKSVIKGFSLIDEGRDGANAVIIQVLLNFIKMSKYPPPHTNKVIFVT